MKRVHYKQRDFYKNKARNRWIFGGNRTGKTHCGAQEAVWWACCTHPNRRWQKKATEGWVVSLSSQVQRDVAQRKVLDFLDIEIDKSIKRAEKNPKANIIKYECIMQSGRASSPARGVIDFIVVKNKFGTESKIGFKNCEQGREKFQGTGLDYIWFDEEPPEDIYDECLLRTLDKKGHIWGTMTPLKGRSWVFDRIFAKPSENLSVISMSWEDNKFLDEKEKQRMRANLSEESLESREHGRFTEGSGLVFKEFSEENILENVSISCVVENAVYTGISIDPGYTNPTAVLWLAIDGDGNTFVVDEYKKSGQSIQQISKDIHNKSKEIGVEVKNVLIDSAAAASTLGEPRSVADQFRAHGVPVDTQVYKNVNDGLHRVKALFRASTGERKLFVLAHCTHLITELRGYFWDDNEKPHKSNDHCIDALRYFVNTERTARKTNAKRKNSSIERFKRRLIHEKI